VRFPLVEDEQAGDEIAAAGPGVWAVQFDDNQPVRVTVPAGQNLRQVIDQQWPGVSASGAVQASPVAALPTLIRATVLQATVEENIINVPPGARMTLAGYHCLVAGWTLDECEAHLRAGLDANVWFIYRGGSHIAVHYRPVGCERVWIVREERLTSDECPQCSRIGAGPLCKAHQPAPEGLGTTKAHADDAPTVAPAIAAGDDVDVFVNQATREGWVLAVLGDEYILEYTMPKGTTALQIRRVDGGNVKDGKWHGSYRNVSYKALPTRWLQAIVDAGSVWEGKAQGVYRAPWRGGYGGSNARVPSAADLLAAKKGGR